MGDAKSPVKDEIVEGNKRQGGSKIASRGDPLHSKGYKGYSQGKACEAAQAPRRQEEPTESHP